MAEKDRNNEPPFPIDRFATSDDVIMRLDNSIVRYKGIPVIVRFQRGMNVSIKDLLNNRLLSENIHSSNPDLDISSPPIGFVNFGLFTSYAQRMPRRNNKQGLNAENTVLLKGNIPDALYYDKANIFTKPVAQAILNDYPTGDQVISAMKKSGDIISMSFHSKFSFVKDDIGIIKLKHMQRTVGYVNPKDRSVIIPEEIQHTYFKDILNEREVRVAN